MFAEFPGDRCAQIANSALEEDTVRSGCLHPLLSQEGGWSELHAPHKRWTYTTQTEEQNNEQSPERSKVALRKQSLRVESLESRHLLAFVLDTTFGVEGLMTTDFTDGANDECVMVSMVADKLVAIGIADSARTSDQPVVLEAVAAVAAVAAVVAVGGGEPTDAVPDFAVARYLGNGVLDTTFGTVDPLTGLRTGKLMTDFGTVDVPTFDEAYGFVALPNGNLLVIGATRPELDAPNDFAMAMYDPSGDLVTSFGGTGLVTTDFGGDDVARKVTLQSVNGQTWWSWWARR